LKIVQINCVYRYGSTGNLVYEINKGLQEKCFSSIVIYGRGKKYKDMNVFKISSELEAKIHSVMSRLFGIDFGYSLIATKKTIRMILKEKPDIVHLHCLNGHFVNVYRLLEYLKSKEINTVLTLHAEIMHTAGCEHAEECEKWRVHCYDCPKVRGMISSIFRDDTKHCFKKIKDAYTGFHTLTIVGVSDWLTSRAKQSPLFPTDTPFFTVGNGLDTDIFKNVNSNELRKRLSIPDEKKILLHVTPNFLHPIKGGKYFLKLAENLPEYQCIIVGFKGGDDVLPKNIIPISHTTDQRELANYYALADLTILTSKRETFSMVVAESLSCGTPVVGFKAGGPETIAIPEYSSFTENGNLELLKGKVEEFLKKNFNKEEISKQAHSIYSRKKMVSEYMEIYKNLMVDENQ